MWNSKSGMALWASAAQAAEWPRLAGAWGSLEHGLALIEASGEPACWPKPERLLFPHVGAAVVRPWPLWPVAAHPRHTLRDHRAVDARGAALHLLGARVVPRAVQRADQRPAQSGVDQPAAARACTDGRLRREPAAGKPAGHVGCTVCACAMRCTVGCMHCVTRVDVTAAGRLRVGGRRHDGLRRGHPQPEGGALH